MLTDEQMAVARCLIGEPEPWGSPVERETKNRVHVAAAAYAYEVEGQPVMSDAEWDDLAKSIDLSIDTTRPEIDKWFRREFQPHTGSWVHRHPDKAGLRRVLAAMRRARA